MFILFDIIRVLLKIQIFFGGLLASVAVVQNFDCLYKFWFSEWLQKCGNWQSTVWHDLKNLRTQLYSAAEYFELSYTNDDQKQIISFLCRVAETLKDYAVKAIVNTVDHLGSVTYKVNDLLDVKVDEVSGTEFSVSCIEQRLRACQEYIDHEGLTQQSLVINTPKYHKRYILPVGETMHGAIHTKSKYLGYSLDNEDVWHQFRNVVRATITETPTSSVRKGRSRSPSPARRPLQPSATFSFTSTMPPKELEKRTVSPHRFPLLRSGSVSSRPTTPNGSRPTTPSSVAAARLRYPSELRKSASMRVQAEKEENSKDSEQYPSKSKRLLKALLSRRKSKKDDMLYSYLDEY
ncbi:protein ABIL2 isoform X3 [Hevea brasiliensis]|uniref:protein ABIL2 isoform X3 n=1 Tax=Hevea brasiliensis TaxID=3981 RepID=UPI0025D4883E|nr:protein ABIL2 isoform X3 [Hevea brasiliensis]